MTFKPSLSEKNGFAFGMSLTAMLNIIRLSIVCFHFLLVPPLVACRGGRRQQQRLPSHYGLQTYVGS
jgi:hypothetical protein